MRQKTYPHKWPDGVLTSQIEGDSRNDSVWNWMHRRSICTSRQELVLPLALATKVSHRVDDMVLLCGHSPGHVMGLGVGGCQPFRCSLVTIQRIPR
jgi:hypothetical protein